MEGKNMQSCTNSGSVSPSTLTSEVRLEQRFQHIPNNLIAQQPNGHPSYCGVRWARSIIRVVTSKEDPSTVKGWGRLVGASRGALATWCRAAKTTPRRSLDLARLLRALLMTGGSSIDLQDVMDIVDPRTVTRMLTRAGFPEAGGGAVHLSAREFVMQQKLVKNEKALSALTALLEQELRGV